MIFLNTPDDMEWVREVHWPELPPEYHSVMLEGNEDCPDSIVAYVKQYPTVDDVGLIREEWADNLKRLFPSQTEVKG